MFLRLLIFTLFLSMTVFSQTQPPIETGVSQTLAKWRAANYSDVRYKLNITLEKGAPLMKGDIEIRVNISEEGAKNDLILDWRTTQFANDKDKPYANVLAVNATGAQASPLANVAESGVEPSKNQQSDKQTSFSRSALKASGTLALQSNEHLIIPKDLLKKGENLIKIQFASPIKTSGAAVTRYVDKEDGAEYVYSLFVPSDASTAFPLFDQPDLKARFSLDITTPIEWKVVSNTIGITRYGENLHHFVETKPISTYVFAFAAGDFELFSDQSFQESLEKERISFPNSRASLTNIYVRKSQAEKFKQHAAEVFRLNREAVKYLESYFDYKFPFPKYDLVLIPEFPFGGMEHAGATFLREDRVIFPTEPTKNDYITRANVIFHEAAHQWFGDTVTMRWFDDLWLKEGFAEFMAYKTLEKVMPEMNAWKIFYERNKQAAYLTDTTKGTTPIYQEIPNLASAKSAYGNIVYRKAPSFLRQAEFYLGADKFQTAVRAFLKKYQFANAEWTDLVKEFETSSKLDLKDWADSWVKQKGVSVVKFTYESTTDKGTKFRFEQNDLFAGESLSKDKPYKVRRINFYLLTEIKSGEKKEFRFKTPNQVAPRPDILGKSVVIDNLTSELNYLFPNYQDYGYGIFLLDERSRNYVLKNIQNEPDDFLRTMMWGALWDSVREAELSPKDYVELVVKNINVERDESTIATLLSRISTAMNYYLSDAQAADAAPKIENLLIDGMKNAPTVGQRITFYRAFLNVAASERARTVLKDVLSGKFGIEGLNCKGEACPSPLALNKVNASGQGQAQPLQSLLKSKDKFDIVTRLLILDDKDAPNLLAELEKTETSDEAKRYAYAAKAGIAAAENKARSFNDFVSNKEISESWIEAAFAPFNSIRHAELTLPYLEKALAELPNLKRTRKIFFVNGWLAAFIGGQKSEEALRTVNKFLADNPNLDKDLRLKILENADGLERAAKIRAKYGK